jgi:cysteine synthase A
MSAVFEDIAAAVGYTPLVRINKLGSGKAEILGKLESKNPCGSIKDRIAKYMVEAAEEAGLIGEEDWEVIVQRTEGLVAEAVRFAETSPEPSLGELYADILA